MALHTTFHTLWHPARRLQLARPIKGLPGCFEACDSSMCCHRFSSSRSAGSDLFAEECGRSLRILASEDGELTVFQCRTPDLKLFCPQVATSRNLSLVIMFPRLRSDYIIFILFCMHAAAFRQAFLLSRWRALGRFGVVHSRCGKASNVSILLQSPPSTTGTFPSQRC